MPDDDALVSELSRIMDEIAHPTPPRAPTPTPPIPPRHRPTRQRRALRKVYAGVALLAVLVLGAGAIEVGLHGLPDFLFRSAGVGSTPDSGLQEAQGPGQPDANGHHGCTMNADGTCATLVRVYTLEAVAPDGAKVTFKSTFRDTWAGIAQQRDGKWVILAKGVRYRRVTERAASSWRTEEVRYQSEWLMVPLRET